MERKYWRPYGGCLSGLS